MKNGKYELIKPPEDYPGKRYRGRYAYEHHVVFWKTNGRLLKSGYVIHHKNDSKRENDYENLEEKYKADHTRDHGLSRGRTLVVRICSWCGISFEREPSKIGKDQSKFYCNRSHQVKGQQRDIKNKVYS